MNIFSAEFWENSHFQHWKHSRPNLATFFTEKILYFFFQQRANKEIFMQTKGLDQESHNPFTLKMNLAQVKHP